MESNSSSHSTSSSLLDHSFHNILISTTRNSTERVSSSWIELLDWQTLKVDDSLDSDSENYQMSRLSLPHGFCCSGVGGFRAALLSGQLLDNELEDLFQRSRSFILIELHGERLLNPRSIFMFIWQLLNLFCTILCALFVPIEVAFLSHDKIISTQLIGAFFEIFFILDIILNFNLPIYSKLNSSLIGNREAIRVEYFKFWFWIDLISSIPLDVCELSLGMDRILSIPGFFQVLRIIRVLKILKLLRLLRTDIILSSLQNHITFKQLELQSMKLLFLILITIHFMSCGLFIIAEWEDTPSNWIDENNIFGATPLIQYTCAIYWATMTATTIGYGDIVMVTSVERAYATICMIIGASVYAFITSKLVGMLIFSPSSSVGTINQQYSNFFSNDNYKILNYFSSTPFVHQAILMDYLNNRHVNIVNDGTKDYLMMLSPKLRGIISRTYFSDIVQSISFFKLPHISLHLLEEICVEFTKHIEHGTFMPGEIVIDKYDPQIIPLKYLYIVNIGSVVLRKNKTNLTLTRLSTFGEDLVLLDYLQDGTYQVRTTTLSYCGLYMLGKNSLLEILTRFPTLATKFRKKRYLLAFKLGIITAIRKMLLKRYREIKSPNKIKSEITSLSLNHSNSLTLPSSSSSNSSSNSLPSSSNSNSNSISSEIDFS